ncbi:MAG: hypothetical protein LC637_03090 [Xanthomonadaceae bacterium]|nr:hypothetical protein [Xanthomonadaceae bacterium]
MASATSGMPFFSSSAPHARAYANQFLKCRSAALGATFLNRSSDRIDGKNGKDEGGVVKRNAIGAGSCVSQGHRESAE